MSNEWKPIAEYDAMKKKPEYAVFYFEAVIADKHRNNGLRAMIDVDRTRGFRVCTKFYVLPSPEQPHDRI